jgi:hypothetical protein
MKKDDEADELRPEYDFGQMPGGVRGKYAEAYRGGTKDASGNNCLTSMVEHRTL